MKDGKSTPMIATACALMLWATTATGASPADSVGTARFEVAADLDSAVVYLDSVHAGYTPLVLEGVVPGTHLVRVVPPRPEDWTVHSVLDTVLLVAGRSHSASYRLRSFIPIRSDPAGAELYMNDSLAGITPLLLRPSALHTDTHLELRRKGFEALPVLPSALTGETLFTLALNAGWQDPSGETTSPLLPSPSWNPRKIGLFASGGVAILAGIGAAYFKIAADGKQESYLATGDPALASERRRLDTLAGVSLALTQAGIIVLTYLLTTE